MEKTKLPETKLPIRSSYDGGMNSDGGGERKLNGSSKLERTGAPGLEIMESRSLFL